MKRICLVLTVLVGLFFMSCSKNDNVVTIITSNWSGMKYDEAILTEGIKRYAPDIVVEHKEVGSLAIMYQDALKSKSDIVISSDGSFGLTMFNDIPWEHDLVKFRDQIEESVNELGYTHAILNVENNYAFFTNQENYDNMGCETMSQVAKLPNIRYGCEFSLYERDSQINFKNALEFYNTASREVIPADNNVLYEAVSIGSIEIFLGETGSGYEKKYGLVEIEDDKKFFPEYRHSLIYKIDIDESVVDVIKLMIEHMNTSTSEDAILRVLNGEATWESVAVEFWDSLRIIRSGDD